MQLATRAMLFGARALVVKEWKVDPDAAIPVVIKGRKAGFISWLLSLLGFDTTTTFELHRNHVSLSEASLAGQIREIVPLTGACNIGTGYLKPFLYIIAAIGCIFWALVYGLNEHASGVAVVWQLILAVGFIIMYFLNKCMVLYVIPISSSPIQIAFKRSVIEGVNVDVHSAKEASDIIVDAIMGSVRKG